MIFGFGKKNRDDDDDDDDELEDEEPQILISFEGPLNKQEIDLETNARLVQAALIPAKEVVSDGVAQRAEFVRIDLKGNAAVVVMSVDGMPVAGEKMAKQKGLAVIQMLKLLGGMDIRERSKPQSGGMLAKYEEIPYEIRLETTPLPDGSERLLIKLRNLKDKLYSPDDLGIPEEIRNKIKEFGASKEGVWLAAGPPRSGTTTTMYAAIRCVDSYLYSFYSIADATGRDLKYLSVYKPNPGDDLPTTLDRVIRMECDDIFVDPLIDAQMAGVVLEKAESVGFMSEMTSKDAAHAIEILATWTNPQLVAERLKGVLSQKLIRKLCDKCREAYKPNAKLLARLGLPETIKKLYRPPTPPDDDDEEEAPPVCSVCHGAAYWGRVAMFEYIDMTPEMQQVISGGGKADDIRAQARKEKMLSLQRDGLRLVVEGKTSLEELQRVFKNG
ncbi:MAG: ATPase, T2SS/T4P/T4SS family [Planctomycetota bacterium]|nr:ATPase, T2SS/T4P/T4SS family [Planctomycetota bacterium]MDA1213179.1 ATPase, T2SS/T4P/T4SS family [Planctomycetota bacterium]